MYRMCPILLGLVVVCLVGCTPGGPSAEVLALRKQHCLAEEPPDAVSVVAAREQLAPGAKSQSKSLPAESQEPLAEGPAADSTPAPLVLVGRIGGDKPQTQLEGFPWEAGKAVFYISDPEEDHGHEGHDHENCPFCARKRNQNWIERFVMIQIVGSDGEPLRVDARELLDVKEGQTVVVRGQAELMNYGLLVVKADGIYVRR